MRRWIDSARRIASVPFGPLWRFLHFVAPQAPDQALHRLVWAVVSFILTTVVGVIGYVLIADFSPFDALYQTILTLTTVGFQELYPLSREARAFTIFLMVFGVGIVVYLLGVITTLVLEGDLYRDVAARRRRRMIDQLEGHTVFVGAGPLGMVAANILADEGATLLLIDQDPNALQDARERNWLVLNENAELESVLCTARLEQAGDMWVMTGTDSANLVIIIRARKLAPDLRITARANDPRNEDLLLEAGATEVISPAGLMIQQIAADRVSRV